MFRFIYKERLHPLLLTLHPLLLYMPFFQHVTKKGAHTWQVVWAPGKAPSYGWLEEEKPDGTPRNEKQHGIRPARRWYTVPTRERLCVGEVWATIYGLFR